MSLRWQQMTDAERNREYSPSSCLPDGDYVPFVEAYRRVSDRVWADLGHAADVHLSVVRYGRALSQTVDVAVPTSPERSVPLLVFFHGGYWQELSKTDSRFAAQHCLERGWGFAAVDYTLAPAATLDEIVDECRRALRRLHRDAPALHVDRARITVAGSSAGAHLAAMAAYDPPDPACEVHAAVLVSGVFELEPLVGTSINEALGLDTETARRNSPMRLDLGAFPTTLLAYGENETSEFKAQSEQFARCLEAAGTRATTIEIPARNHFDVILDLAAPDTTLGDAVADLVDRPPSAGG